VFALLCAVYLCLAVGFALMVLMFRRRDGFLGLVGLTVLILAGVLGTVHGALTS